MKRLSVTNGILLVNIFFFFISLALFTSVPGSLSYLALQPRSVLEGKFFWTFLTSMFLHADLLHLFVNMVTLFFIGNLVERLIGMRRYLGFYFFSGLFAGVFFVLSALIFPADLEAYAVGASGALFGLGGVLMFLTPDLPVYLMFFPIPVKMKYAMPLMLVLLWVLSFAAKVPIGNTAHLGGLFAGVVYGAYLRVKYRRRVEMIGRYFR